MVFAIEKIFSGMDAMVLVIKEICLTTKTIFSVGRKTFSDLETTLAKADSICSPLIPDLNLALMEVLK